jgi:hypothetical protein
LFEKQAILFDYRWQKADEIMVLKATVGNDKETLRSVKDRRIR